MANAEFKFSQNPTLKIQKLFLGAQIFLRISTVATTMAAALVMLTNKQTIQLGDFTLDARYSYASAFKFLAVANVVVCACSVLSVLLLLIVAHRGSNPAYYFILFLHDLLMMSLILAGSSAATAIALVGKYGNNHTGWVAICEQFGRFCHRATVSLALSYLSLALFVMLTVTSANKSRKIEV